MKLRARQCFMGIASLLCGLATAADIPLPNGYVIIETQPNEHTIIHDAAVVVFGNVEQFVVVGSVVAGFVTKPQAPKAEPDYYDDVQAGYFLLDTKTGVLAMGLDVKSWNALAQKFGLSKQPSLKPTCKE
jgi:hypothetical protein